MPRLHAVLLALALAVALPVSAGQEDPLDRPAEVRIDGPVSVGRIYEILGALLGRPFVLDEGVRADERIEPEFGGLSYRQALELLDLQLGLARVRQADGIWLVYPDNQTKRREHEQQAVRTIFLQHLEPIEANAILRGILDVRKTAVDQQLNVLVIRDTEEKVALAAELFERLDVPPGEADLRVELWALEAPAAERLRRALEREGVPRALIARERLDEVRSRKGVQALIDVGLPLVDGEQAILTLSDQGGDPLSGVDPVATGFRLTARPRLVAEERTLLLPFECEANLPPPPDRPGRLLSRELEATVRIPEGQVYVALRLGRVAEAESGAQGGRPLFEADGRELALVLTPRIRRLPAWTAGQLESFRIGTDRRPRAPRERREPGS